MPNKCCPYCGGITGFMRIENTPMEQGYTWDFRPTECNPALNGITKESKVGQCLDCGKKFKISILTLPDGWEEA